MTDGSKPEILPTHTAALFAAAVARAAAALRAGEVVALPTETVYGLAANAWDAAAVERIYEVKGRPRHNPIIVHVGSVEMARACVREWPVSASRLASAFWPGPLTLVLGRSGRVPDVVTAGGETVGVRWPSHPLMQEVIRACGFPLAAPSANPANAISPTDAEHVRRSLGVKAGLIVDGGRAQVGIESTVVDLTGDRPRVLRPGMIHGESLGAVLGVAVAGEGDSGGGAGAAVGLRSPGLLPKHYAPRARVMVAGWESEEALQGLVSALGVSLDRVHIIAHSVVPSAARFGGVSVIPHDAEAYARAIYAEWHRCDEAGAEWIVVESVPLGGEWQGVADRLRRASGGG